MDGEVMGAQEDGLCYKYEGLKVCCACALYDAERCGMPDLFFCVNLPKRVPCNEKCDVCLSSFCSPKSFDAAKEITKYKSPPKGAGKVK